MPRLLARLGVVVAAGLAFTVGGGVAASAHVTVHSDDAAHGGYAEIAFRVPTESDTASTVKVQVAFPADTPIASVSVLPHPGWTYQVTKSKAVSAIEWTASGPDSAVKPGEYEVFHISAGPLPDSDRLVFKVVQTYDDGQAVRWIDLPVAGGPEPEHPAPVLSLAAASVSERGDVATVAKIEPAVPPAGTPVTTWWALAVAGAALLTALGAVVLAMRSHRSRSRVTAG